MRVGISVASSHDVADVRLGARWMVERARAARAAGLDSLFVGDHHVTAQPYYQNSPILGRMLAEWGDATAGALYLLPLWNPVLVAEQTATLATIALGPFVLQCALGGDERQSRGMGVDPRARRPMFEESLATIRALWRGERVTTTGHWRLENARISPLPPQPIEVWIGASAPRAIERAARFGDAWLADPAMDSNASGRAIGMYQEACACHGRAPSTIAIRRDVYVGESSAEARRTMAPYLARGHRGFPEDALVIGDVAEVAERFAALGRQGYTDVIVRNITVDQSQALATIERLARVREQLAREGERHAQERERHGHEHERDAQERERDAQRHA
jgi:alkanesulfonate monooxygenase SsuD/methylene tetrahydromethanopterin reductase-like flavin-dependent oxidoreductase (luciferase family)